MILEVLQFPDPRLREQAEPIPREGVDAGLRQLAADMASTMYAEPGIGLAATQVGVALRLAVVDTEWATENGERNLRVLLNPEIIDREGRAVSEEEACLSVPDFKADVDRDARVVIRARDLEWEEITIEATGLEAFCLQHEIDHLDGVLFIDHISRLKRGLYVKRRQKQLRREIEESEAPLPV